MHLPSTLRRIEYRSFEDCQNLKDISLPEGLTYIGEICFKDSALESITVPATLNKVESSAFSGCKRLKRAEFLEGRTAFGTVDADVWNAIFRECGVEELTLPSTLSYVSLDLFRDCRSLKVVRVKKGGPIVKGLADSRVEVQLI